MATMRVARACSVASIATVLLASVSLPGLVLAQEATTGVATTNATSAATDAATANSRRGRPGGGGGGGAGQQPVDPGVRAGDTGTGRVLQGLNADERAFWFASIPPFEETVGVADGLGPRFNLDSCGGCHIQSALGGSSPAINPQVAIATALGARNKVPSFITADGPIREARFVRNPDGTPDGGVHGLFVISGRSDAGNCNIQQEDFEAQVRANNVIFRIPTPTFGTGLMELVPDSKSSSGCGRQRTAQARAGHLGTLQHERQ